GARHRRAIEAPAIRLCTQLCGMGGGGVHRRHHRDGLDRNVAGRRAMNLLDAVLLLPLAGFFLLLLAPKKTERMVALIFSLAVFVVSLGLIAPYWFQSPSGYTFSTNISWIESPAIHYHIALDG